jgi:hypothetical protein
MEFLTFYLADSRIIMKTRQSPMTQEESRNSDADRPD